MIIGPARSIITGPTTTDWRYNHISILNSDETAALALKLNASRYFKSPSVWSAKKALAMFSLTSYNLTEEQRRMYASEKAENFRWISKIVATYSSYTLTEADLAPESLYLELAELGEFAEIAYNLVPTEFILDNYEKLRQPGYPLEYHNALGDVKLLSSFRGTFADLPVNVIYRPSTKQLLVAVSGTSSIKHAFQDLRVLKTSHPSKRGSVHSGFWALYQGIRSIVLDLIRQGITSHSPAELVLTGHSMGGSICYLLGIELLAHDEYLVPRLRLKIAVFGCPRAGDARLVDYYRELVAAFRKREGNDAFTEYVVKGYNDGVPALPPTRFGYRHFCQEPFYLVGGKLYRTPSTEAEHALFRVESDNNDDQNKFILFPKGGHNYYNGRDLEKFSRRMNWLIQSIPTQDGWEERYAEIAKKHT
uniref:Fungal lipase-type domain-containing protein n=1 Tax=Psilocybe cubensis TaxID=181762 RepID=A0A8H7XZ06_PSICU